MLVISLFIFFSPLYAQALECPIPRKIDILTKTENGFTARWEITDHLETPAPPSVYSSWVKQNTSLSAYQIIANHLKLISRLGESSDTRNVKLVLDKNAGRVHPINCLENFAFEQLLKVADLKKESQELLVVIFEKGKDKILLGDFYRGQDGAGVAASNSFEKERTRLERSGWVARIHLHNHPFDFSNPYGDIGGVLVPSSTDIKTYRQNGFSSALITNGVETMEFSNEELAAFE